MNKPSDKTAKFLMYKEDIESGQFPIEHLKQFSKNNNICVIIKDHARIENGEIFYYDRSIH